MENPMRRVMFAAVMLGLMAGATGRAHAGIIMTLSETGGNVVLSGSGTANLAGLTFNNQNQIFSTVVPNGSAFATGPAGPVGPVDEYRTVTGPTSFGQGGFTAATSGTGDRFGIDELVFNQVLTLVLIVPRNYASGSTLNGSGTYVGSTFASLGATPGTYLYTWGTGANADSLTLQIGTAAVPEPSSLALCGIAGAIGLTVARVRRKRSA
jgi:hypothetical protein